MRHPYKTINLDREELRTSYRLDPRQISLVSENSRHTVIEDEIMKSLTHELAIYVYGRCHPSKLVVTYPANWWQALKEQFFPKWLIHMYPVEYVSNYVTMKEYYPEFTPTVPEGDPVCKIYITESLHKGAKP